MAQLVNVMKRLEKEERLVGVYKMVRFQAHICFLMRLSPPDFTYDEFIHRLSVCNFPFNRPSIISFLYLFSSGPLSRNPTNRLCFYISVPYTARHS